jgi:hypothetical protein
MLGAIFFKAQNKIQDPAKLSRLVQLIDAESWIVSFRQTCMTFAAAIANFRHQFNLVGDGDERERWQVWVGCVAEPERGRDAHQALA